MTQVAKKTVLVTGAAMGMGRLHAERAVERGASQVVLWDVNQAALEETASALRTRGGRVTTDLVNVADPEGIEEAAHRVLSEVGPIQVLFNNAGIVVPGDFLSFSTGDIERVIRINTLGVMHVARAFLPGMIQSPEGHLVNIASASAFMPLPYGAVYAASKWAVLGWSESVRLELEDAGHRHVRVTTVCPSFVATGMFEGATAPRTTRFLHPHEIVDAVWNGLEHNKIMVTAPFMAKTVLPLRALLPRRVFDWLGRSVFGSYSAMKGLRGRTGGSHAVRPAAEKPVPVGRD